jgi:hypothetical protein
MTYLEQPFEPLALVSVVEGSQKHPPERGLIDIGLEID